MGVPTIGSIVECKCGKCNDVTGHNVMVIVGGEILRVECRACGSVHKYRPPERPGSIPGGGRGKSAGGATGGSTGSRAAAGKTAGASGRGAQARMDAERWEKAAQRAINDAVAVYSPQGSFEVGALIRHPVFGLGEVITRIPPDKMDILFEEGIKRLLCNK